MEAAKVMKILERGKALTWDYDEEADVLYVSVGPPTKAMGVDVGTERWFVTARKKMRWLGSR